MSNSVRRNSDRDDRVFKALASSTRRAMLDMLRDRRLTTGALVDLFPKLDRCTIMQHLRVLERADLILIEREGRLRWNRLNPLPIHAIHERWIGRHAASAVSLLARLKSDLEAEPHAPPRISLRRKRSDSV